jgi:ADP-ribose pyrophosphatase YjhB (NUDIX family)
MRLRNLLLLSSALLPSLVVVRAAVRLLTRGGHAGSFITTAWAWSFHLPVPYGLRVQALRMLGYSFLVGAVAVIRDADGRLLLARHTYPVGRSRREVWALPGGAVEKYENIPQALRREIAQELHLDVAVERLLLVDTSDAPRLDFVFACATRAGSFRPSSEVAEIGWFSLAEPPDGMSTRHLRLLKRAAEQPQVTIFT